MLGLLLDVIVLVDGVPMAWAVTAATQPPATTIMAPRKSNAGSCINFIIVAILDCEREMRKEGKELLEKQKK